MTREANRTADLPKLNDNCIYISTYKDSKNYDTDT